MQKSIFTYKYKLLLEKIKQARINSGLTQVDAARKLGTTQSFISKVESGERRLDIVELLMLADVYNFDASTVIKSLKR